MRCEHAFHALTRNLKRIPEMENPDTIQDLFIQGSDGNEAKLVWQFKVPARHLSERWIPCMDQSEPFQTFRFIGHSLVTIPNRRPTGAASMRCIMVRSPRFSNSHIHMGDWRRGNLMMLQYKWRDGTDLLHSSTTQLRILQTMDLSQVHIALSKWEAQLSCTIPVDIWESIWVPYRSAAENTFLWQLLYRIPATNKWRFPNCPTSNPNTLCSRCSLQVQEDVLHCIWGCAASRECPARMLGLVFWHSIVGTSPQDEHMADGSPRLRCFLGRISRGLGRHLIDCGLFYVQSCVGWCGRIVISRSSTERLPMLTGRLVKHGLDWWCMSRSLGVIY